MPSNAHEILFRTSIAACNSDDHLRVYMRDVRGKISETVYENGWSSGAEKNVVASAKTFSPLACTSNNLEKIRVFYLSSENTIEGIAYNQSEGWFEGSIGKKRFITAPYSKLAVCHFEKGSDIELRVYGQLADNTIQEFGFKAVLSLLFSVYFQDLEHSLVEKCHDANRGWYDGFTKFPTMQPRAALACTSFAFGSDNISIHIFYSTASEVLEMVHDGRSWREGQFQADCIPGTEIACLSWISGSSSEIRVYAGWSGGLCHL
ncbi:hypothetical protein PENANT_c007G03169 [Penicillium antarcticum]|uniref:Fucose-specific lectin n=1 Tax=Penicillium antarcticum TaxID=416450 RepID=A0A1V6QCL3_9EURO|nr:hypothetical protein PENANT_c007G03169 [Penicillium antarcticum]